MLQPSSFQIIIRRIVHKNSRRWSKRFVLNNPGFLSNIHSEVVLHSDYYFTSSHMQVCCYIAVRVLSLLFIFISQSVWWWLITWHYCLRWLAQSSGCRSERPWGKMGDLLQNGTIRMLSQVGQSVNVSLVECSALWDTILLCCILHMQTINSSKSFRCTENSVLINFVLICS